MFLFWFFVVCAAPALSAPSFRTQKAISDLARKHSVGVGQGSVRFQQLVDSWLESNSSLPSDFESTVVGKVRNADRLKEAISKFLDESMVKDYLKELDEPRAPEKRHRSPTSQGKFLLCPSLDFLFPRPGRVLSRSRLCFPRLSVLCFRSSLDLVGYVKYPNTSC